MTPVNLKMLMSFYDLTFFNIELTFTFLIQPFYLALLGHGHPLMRLHPKNFSLWKKAKNPAHLFLLEWQLEAATAVLLLVSFPTVAMHCWPGPPPALLVLYFGLGLAFQHPIHLYLWIWIAQVLAN